MILHRIAYTIRHSVRTAKEDYGTGQEEEQRKPQAQRGSGPQIECGAQDEAHRAFARRIPQAQRAQDGRSKRRRETSGQEDCS